MRAITALDTFDVLRMRSINFGQWHTTTTAVGVGALLQSMRQRDPLIEHIAFTLPQTVVGIALAQIPQNAAF